MSAKPLRTRSKSASAERCLRPLGATIDMATPDPKTSNGFSVQGIFAWGFTKRQPGGRGGYRVLSLSGNCWTKDIFNIFPHACYAVETRLAFERISNGIRMVY